MAAAVYPSLVQRSELLHGVVETAGTHGRGALFFDWLKSYDANDVTNAHRPNVSVVQALDQAAFEALMLRVFSP